MKILHTSDWHLGRSLYSKKDRYDEHQAFLQWLLEILRAKQIDVLLIAGDIFDIAFPNNASQKMYYDFLVSAIKTGCRHIVVTGGNHDSPSFLNAPKDVLSALNVTVIGSISDNPEDEIITIRNTQGEPEAIICAVPFLRERDISRFSEGESYADRALRVNLGIKKHYAEIAELAEIKRRDAGKWIPVIATGHLSVVGGLRGEDDGVRETYIGNIEALPPEIFPDTFDYVALGHFHIPIAIRHNIRYCGSPIPMGFDEAAHPKLVFVIEFQDDTEKMEINKVEIPVFQTLASVKGNKQEIETRLEELKKKNESVWAEIIYTGDEIFPNLTDWVNQITEKSNIEVINIKNLKYIGGLLSRHETNQKLEDLNEAEVFRKLLEKRQIPESQQQELTALYNEILESIKNPENL